MSNQQQQISVNKLIGQNVLAWRDLSAMSQAEVANLMAGLGFSWQQQTVLKVEKGSRPLRLEEAAALAGILAVSVEDLLATGSPSRAKVDLLYTRQRINQVRADIRSHEDQLNVLRDELARLEAESAVLRAQAKSASQD